MSPAFPEWMMGFPEGWVTGCDIPNAAMLRCIGNAVCVPVAEVIGRRILAQEAVG